MHALLVVSLLFAIAALFAWALVVRHAFRLSVGAGFMVLAIPFFALYYAFVQFEHPRKGAVVAVFLGGWGLSLALQLFAAG